MNATKFARLKAQHWGSPVPGHLVHAQNSYAARVYGCDCRKCLPSGWRRRPNGQGKTAAERQAEYKARKFGQPVPPGTRHGAHTYRVYGCRCDLCIYGNRRARAGLRKRWLESATGSWSVRDDKDVIHWPPVGEGMWLCPECNEKFEMRRPVHANREAA